MVAFATSFDLETRLNREFDEVDRTQIDALMDDASEHLRSIIGQDVYPAHSVSLVIWANPGDREIRLPIQPVRSVTSITIDGQTVTGVLILDVLRLTNEVRGLGYEPVPVTVALVVGYASIPTELTSWTCVLVSQVLAATVELGTLGSGEVSSLGIDDYHKGYTTSEAGAFGLPPRVADRLRARYGSGGAYVVETRATR